jgi:signal transduction histidine kinase
VAPLVAAESARPYFEYGAFYPAERAYTKMFAELGRGEILVPSPLLTRVPEHVLLHFQLGPGGELTSPQAPTGNMRDLAESRYTSYENVEQATRRLESLKSVITRDALLALLLPGPLAGPDGDPPATSGTSRAEQRQMSLSTGEWTARRRRASMPSNASTGVRPAPRGVSEGVMTPLWVGGKLVLARRIEVEGKSYLQGAWVDWPGLKARLLDEMKDRLPDADIEPVPGRAGTTRAGTSSPSTLAPPAAEGEPAPQMRMLASLPARLVPGGMPPEGATAASPIRISLVIAWVCVVLGAGAVAALLSGALSLSERRGAFVSAVTHELRTPLTTFRMYAEMLERDMVPDDEKRREYLKTLCTEADRLGHLVENVLAYARLEGSSSRERAEAVTFRDLLERADERLRRRASSAGMEIVTDATDDATGASVMADASAVEQILFNLVDNACKYAAPVSAAGAEPDAPAASGADRRIHLEAGRSGGFVTLGVRDHGPGIAPRDARRLFRPFSKSARDAADSAPGVGLGLALSRRLARSMGGDLRCDPGAAGGARFVLSLPVADRGGRSSSP